VDRDELGATLRAWRERLSPADMGLPAGVRRRTPGLRREEVAQLAGVSVDYLNRLEQGRGARPSEGVLGALARNMAWLRFAGRSSRVGSDDPAEQERLDRALVSDLRAAAARYPDDPGLRRLVQDLRARSADFERLWGQRALTERHSDRKRVRHPDLGDLDLDCDTLLVHGDDQLLLVCSAAPDTREAEALALLRVVGLQDLATPNR
jgi:transcriptional regulator with XRE-family HTH domain